MSAGERFNSDVWYSRTYDVVAYNDNAETDECTYIVLASFVSHDDATAFVDDDDTRGIIGVRPPRAEYMHTVRWLAASADH